MVNTTEDIRQNDLVESTRAEEGGDCFGRDFTLNRKVV
jgi:hypothetical protein